MCGTPPPRLEGSGGASFGTAFICMTLFRNTTLKQLAYTDSPNRQSKQPFHHGFMSDFHMDYDLGLGDDLGDVT